MKIEDGWTIEDGVSGLKIEVVSGEKLNRLHIENLHASDGVVDNRDFWFTKKGKFDGTGSSCAKGIPGDIPADIDPEYEAAKADLT